MNDDRLAKIAKKQETKPSQAIYMAFKTMVQKLDIHVTGEQA